VTLRGSPSIGAPWIASGAGRVCPLPRPGKHNRRASGEGGGPRQIAGHLAEADYFEPRRQPKCARLFDGRNVGKPEDELRLGQ
jgi:hypothetical protein